MVGDVEELRRRLGFASPLPKGGSIPNGGPLPNDSQFRNGDPLQPGPPLQPAPQNPWMSSPFRAPEGAEPSAAQELLWVGVIVLAYAIPVWVAMELWRLAGRNWAATLGVCVLCLFTIVLLVRRTARRNARRREMIKNSSFGHLVE